MGVSLKFYVAARLPNGNVEYLTLPAGFGIIDKTLWTIGQQPVDGQHIFKTIDVKHAKNILGTVKLFE